VWKETREKPSQAVEPQELRSGRGRVFPTLQVVGRWWLLVVNWEGCCSYKWTGMQWMDEFEAGYSLTREASKSRDWVVQGIVETGEFLRGHQLH